MLSEIYRILEVCKSIVSRLSSQDVDVSVKSAPANIQNTTLCNDDEMWWDQSDVSGQMSFDPNNNNILNVEAILDDSILDDVQLFPSDSDDHSDDDDDGEDSIAVRVKLRKLAQCQSPEASVPNVQEQQLATSQDPFIEKMTRFINMSSPGHVFNVKKSMKKKKKRAAKMVHPELVTLWRNVGDLFANQVSVSTPDPSIPVVDWSKVNSRFIANIPAPSPQPLSGCSEDPEFYEHKNVRRCQPSGAVTWETKWSPHKSSKTPFGTKLGFLTDAGVIKAESNHQIVHGYIWSPSCNQYILHAKFPGELERSEVSSKRRKKKRGSR